MRSKNLSHGQLLEMFVCVSNWNKMWRVTQHWHFYNLKIDIFSLKTILENGIKSEFSGSKQKGPDINLMLNKTKVSCPKGSSGEFNMFFLIKLVSVYQLLRRVWFFVGLIIGKYLYFKFFSKLLEKSCLKVYCGHLPSQR